MKWVLIGLMFAVIARGMWRDLTRKERYWGQSPKAIEYTVMRAYDQAVHRKGDGP